MHTTPTHTHTHAQENSTMHPTRKAIDPTMSDIEYPSLWVQYVTGAQIYKQGGTYPMHTPTTTKEDHTMDTHTHTPTTNPTQEHTMNIHMQAAAQIINESNTITKKGLPMDKQHRPSTKDPKLEGLRSCMESMDARADWTLSDWEGAHLHERPTPPMEKLVWCNHMDHDRMGGLVGSSVKEAGCMKKHPEAVTNTANLIQCTDKVHGAKGIKGKDVGAFGCIDKHPQSVLNHSIPFAIDGSRAPRSNEEARRSTKQAAAIASKDMKGYSYNIQPDPTPRLFADGRRRTSIAQKGITKDMVRTEGTRVTVQTEASTIGGHLVQDARGTGKHEWVSGKHVTASSTIWINVDRTYWMDKLEGASRTASMLRDRRSNIDISQHAPIEQMHGVPMQLAGAPMFGNVTDFINRLRDGETVTLMDPTRVNKKARRSNMKGNGAATTMKNRAAARTALQERNRLAKEAAATTSTPKVKGVKTSKVKNAPAATSTNVEGPSRGLLLNGGPCRHMEDRRFCNICIEAAAMVSNDKIG